MKIKKNEVKNCPCYFKLLLFHLSYLFLAKDLLEEMIENLNLSIWAIKIQKEWERGEQMNEWFSWKSRLMGKIMIIYFCWKIIEIFKNYQLAQKKNETSKKWNKITIDPLISWVIFCFHLNVLSETVHSLDFHF